MDFVNATLVTSLQRFAPNGVILWNIFIPKPDVPPAIAANYRQVIRHLTHISSDRTECLYNIKC